MNDDAIEPLLQQGIAHHQAGHFSEAQTIYRQVLARRPDQPDALHYLGVLAGQAGDHQTAIDLIRRAVSFARKILRPGSISQILWRSTRFHFTTPANRIRPSRCCARLFR